MGIGIVSTNKRDFTFPSSDDAIKFIRTAAQEQENNDTGDVWLSYNDKNQKEVTFIADGSEWKPNSDAVIALNDAFSCIRDFSDTYVRPCCIQWQEL